MENSSEGDSSQESTCQCGRHRSMGSDPWVRNISWRRKWQPMPVLLPGKFHGQRSLVGVHGDAESQIRLTTLTHTWLRNCTLVTCPKKMRTLIQIGTVSSIFIASIYIMEHYSVMKIMKYCCLQQHG